MLSVRSIPSTGWMRFLPHHGRLATAFRLLLPSFIADVLFPDHRPTWKLHPTSYLDGLRGIASIIVFFCHYTENNFRVLTVSYGLNPDRSPSFIQLPYFRIIFSGRPMVHIFFVISGFALSYKPIKCLHARDLEKCYQALASSTFRRAVRLFGPCIVSTFMILCLRQMGYLTPAQDTFMGEFWKWKNTIFHQITWPWSWDYDHMPAYDIHLWTIPIEFAHSMLLFIAILMFSRVRLRIRMAGVFGMMIYCLTCGKWAGFEFLSGMLLAEIFVLKAAHSKDWESTHLPKEENRTLKTAKMLFQILIVVVGLFIGGWPNRDADKTPGIRFFLASTPSPFSEMDKLAPQKFWFGVSALFMVWAIGELKWLKRLFETPLAQYSGRVSFAVYIMHGPVLGLFEGYFLGRPSVAASGTPGAPDYQEAVKGWGVKGYIGTRTPTTITLSWFIGLLVLGPLVIWAADVFWRAVDNTMVNLGKRLENACLDESTPSPRAQGYALAA